MNGPTRRPLNQPLGGEVEIDPSQSALLLIDMRNYNCIPEGGGCVHLEAAEKAQRYSYFFGTLRDSALPNLVASQRACRRARIEVKNCARLPWQLSLV